MESIWKENISLRERQQLQEDIRADVAVIGAGMAGLLTACLLQEKGIQVVVIDGDAIAGGVTQNTTAKITSQHDLIYKKLITDFGQEKASQYAQANQKAIKKYEEIISKKSIDCDFENKSAYLYTSEDPELIHNEIAAAQSLGIPAQFVTDVNLPFKIKGAEVFTDQAQFHPLKFIRAISEELDIYEHTWARRVEKNEITTDHGKIIADSIVVATHYPFINVPGYYFLKTHQERSYFLALENAMQVNGMFKSIDKDGNSFRNYGSILLLGGGKHRTGDNKEGGKYEDLRKLAKNWFPQATEKTCWSAQDCMTVDDIPYIGQYSISTPNMYVATGFKKWGMTGSMVSAMILTDMIAGEKNEYADVFSPQRMDIAASAKTFLQNTAEVVSGLASEIFEIPNEKLGEIKNGEGAIVDYKGQKAGVYKTESGEVHIVSTKCAHMGCQLEWNPDEKSWDCPCHGSRFDYRGNVINNPAMKGVKV